MALSESDLSELVAIGPEQLIGSNAWSTETTTTASTSAVAARGEVAERLETVDGVRRIAACRLPSARRTVA